MSADSLEINGWTIYAHPLFLDQLEQLIVAVEKAKAKDPAGYQKKRAAKLLAAVLKVAFENIPGDPTRDSYRQGDTLGDDYKHWFRAKFLQQFRLFFRYQQSGETKIIVLAWVNDGSTLRAYGSATDAYAVFRKMLKRGNPPDDWKALLKSGSDNAAKRRLARSRPKRGT
ncbi:type II toxin-antitoxin system YhaV family toxin [Roseiarcaceae bacterium H3SJ34-1]|uniref:type II toxin-antitoxin system YhaV family toxin n=1 Tax=Terripilifer ovatus TaxID=3032367 RepID=UPI003AB99F71|nr:type II toxin-antitoxin system YhaV family toxin [Roseiarcaceae bacterium H3SJ34-1]